MSVLNNLELIREEIDETAQKYGYSPAEINSITIMAVTKTLPKDRIIEAHNAGLALFGENRVDEANNKYTDLDANMYPVAMIGHLQGNKISRVSKRIFAVHSVDSEVLAQKLSRHRTRIDEPLEILLQVNTSGENAKSGIKERGECTELAALVSELPALKLRGLMTMAPFVDNEKIVRSCFSACRDWSTDISRFIDGTPTLLSMGMSSDYKWALAEGSNLLRLGTSLFGNRP